jgi:hypothetical protein
MVLNPQAYTFQLLDFDVLFSNSLNLRKYHDGLETSKGKAKSKGGKTPDKIEESPDIVEARRIARALRNYLQSNHPSKNDQLIFEGENVYDPLETVEWFNALPESGQPSGNSGKGVMVRPHISLIPEDGKSYPKLTLHIKRSRR